ncbi:hypothetical protein V8F33_005475 [Rhypophila sp. PSN 637]
MASADDQVYRRVGRGGAGNWYSKKDVEEVEKAQQQADIEAQKQNIPSAAGPANPIAASTQYHRAGRGGAGNFHEPATAPDGVDPMAVQQTEEQIEKIKAAVAAQKPRTGGMGGRGGVGNWSNSNSVNVQQQEKEEQKKVQEVELRVLKDVEAGLAMPKPAYQRASTDREDGVAN